jgi:hypothetical protein
VALAGSTAPAPTRVTVIADSVGGALDWDQPAREVLAQRLDLRIEERTCRRIIEPGCSSYGYDAPESALATVERLGPELGPIVVMNVGYNDPSPGYADALDQVMTALVAAGVQHVIWVTLEETQGVWVQINEQIRAAPARWPQLTVADWAPVAAGQDWFVDIAHMNSIGALAYAKFLRPFVLDACGHACDAPFSFCGLARTANGFDPVRAAAVPCGLALPDVVAIERGDRGDWACSRAVNAAYELECRNGEDVIQVLERSPVPAVRRRSGVVRLANWLFLLRGRRLLAREDGTTGWVTIGHAPFCVPTAPREVLVALKLRALTPHGGCFG